jgi:hypothetical protein
MRRPSSISLLGLALLCAAVPARAQDSRTTRAIEVPRAGWVRVPLGPDVVHKAEGAGGALRLFGPEGEDVPFLRVPADESGPRVAAREVKVAQGPDGGWQVEVSLGEEPARHDRLLLDLSGGDRHGAPLSGELRLSGSSDGEDWKTLVVGAPEPAGTPGPDGTVIVALPYPASAARLLRLSGWPAGGPRPEVRDAAVEAVPARSYHLSLPIPDCRSPDARSPASARTVCRLPVGGAGRYLRRLDLVVEGGGAVGYRLLRAEDGRWESVGEGIWRRAAGEAPRCLPLGLSLSEPAESLRLELYAAGDEAPAVRDYGADFAGEALLFRAHRAGTHTLAYGTAVVPASPGTARRPPPDAEPMRIEAGPPEASPAPGSLPPLPDSGGAAPAIHFAGTWPVTAEEEAAPGELYRLTLPPPVYGVARDDLRDVRLIASDVQVPYARWRPAEPVLAAGLREAAPVPAETAGHSRLELSLPAPRPPVSSLVVSAPAGRFKRRVRVLYPGAAGDPAAGGTQAASPWLEWQCAAEAPLPCRITVALNGTPGDRVAVEIDDRRAEPLPAVDLELWRRRDVLLFPWPSGERALALGAGAPELEAPGYDLAGRLDELLARPWHEARVVLDQSPGGEGGRIGTWAVAVTLVVATAILLLLLHGLLREQEER